jgi:hypothetical protein
VSDGLAARQFIFCPVPGDMDPLLVAGRVRKAVDTILSDFTPLVGPDLGANRSPEFTEVAEDAHVESSNVHDGWSDPHFRNGCWNGKFRFRHRHNLGNGDAWGGLPQRYLPA